MLKDIDDGLKKTLWDEAANPDTDLLNILTKSGTKSNSFQQFFGKGVTSVISISTKILCEIVAVVAFLRKSHRDYIIEEVPRVIATLKPESIFLDICDESDINSSNDKSNKEEKDESESKANHNDENYAEVVSIVYYDAFDKDIKVVPSLNTTMKNKVVREIREFTGTNYNPDADKIVKEAKERIKRGANTNTEARRDSTVAKKDILLIDIAKVAKD